MERLDCSKVKHNIKIVFFFKIILNHEYVCVWGCAHENSCPEEKEALDSPEAFQHTVGARKQMRPLLLNTEPSLGPRTVVLIKSTHLEKGH